MDTMLWQRVYASTGRVLFSDQQLNEMLAECRINNLINQINGLLIYGNQTFFQVIEGPKISVDDLWEKLQRDTRHTNVALLLSRKAPRLLFKDWSMAFEKMDSPLALQVVGLADLLSDYKDGLLFSEQEVIQLIGAFSERYEKITGFSGK